MNATWGNHFKITIFGESHGEAIGVVIDGVPSGIALDHATLAHEMARRAPGQTDTSTPRREADAVQLLSGVFQGYTTGAPLCAMIQNTNTISKDYDPSKLRPGHADFTAWVKYKGFADYRGGGHFSGRLTAPLVYAGAIAKQVLSQSGIQIGARILSICDITDSAAAPERIIEASKSDFPVVNASLREPMRAAILSAKAEEDSVGGVVECVATGLPVGKGAPLFGSVEGSIASMMFAIPAVKGIEFGLGFGLTTRRGSEVNDAMHVENGIVRHTSNHNGGILGGITNGEALVFRVAIKPTATIAKEQQTVDINTMTDTTIQSKGRHDPCIVPRALPVVEAGLAICLLDLMGEQT